MRACLRWRGLAAVTAVLAGMAGGVAGEGTAPPDGPPPALRDTGLYADFDTLVVDPRHLAFAPQYPLWTDGASKRRWISLPPGTAIDASDPDAWVFPPGTRFWKEFSFAGRRVETRLLERLTDGQWRYAAYEWSADGRDARLAPGQGRRAAFPLGDGKAHAIPSVSDCRVCHEARRLRCSGSACSSSRPTAIPAALHAEARRPRRASTSPTWPTPACSSDCPPSLLGRRRGSRPLARPSGRRSATSTAIAATATIRTASFATSGCSCGTCRRSGGRAGHREHRRPAGQGCGARTEPGRRAPRSTPGVPSEARSPSASGRATRRCRCRRSAPSWRPGGRRTGPAMDREPG